MHLVERVSSPARLYAIRQLRIGPRNVGKMVIYDQMGTTYGQGGAGL